MKTQHQDVGSPQLRPKDLNGADSAVLVIETVELRKSRFADKGESKPTDKLVLTFADLPDRELWLNKTGHNACVEHFGEETDDWCGKNLPVIAVRVSVGGETHHTVQVAVEGWDEVLKESGKTAAAPRRVSRRKH